jgi:hypothetical protein
MDTLDFAKILHTTGNACGFDRDDFHREIEKRAAETRSSRESEAQAYTRILQTSEGKELYKAYRVAPMGKPPIQEAQDIPRPEPAGPASKALSELARFEAKAKNISYEQAFSRLLTSPDHRELVREVKREELSATRLVADSRWPLREAERTSQTRQWVDGLDAVGRRRLRPNSL